MNSAGLQPELTMDHLPHYRLPRCGSINPLAADDPNHREIDPRGLIKLWEPPRRRARYVMGVDASAGILHWDRYHRNDEDLTTANGAIEVIRCGDGQITPDIQVAEYAAPIDAEDLADVVALLGRLYAGSSDYGEALCIIEVWPGPGLLTQRRLINHYDYTNLFRWEYLDSIIPKATNSLGWTSNTKTLQMLWSRFSRHMGKKLLKIRSNHLMDEIADLQNLPGKTFPQPAGEMAHDDRVRAMSQAIWASHGWGPGEDIPERESITRDTHKINWQASDITEEAMFEEWEEQFQRLASDY